MKVREPLAFTKKCMNAVDQVVSSIDCVVLLLNESVSHEICVKYKYALLPQDSFRWPLSSIVRVSSVSTYSWGQQAAFSRRNTKHYAMLFNPFSWYLTYLFFCSVTEHECALQRTERLFS